MCIVCYACVSITLLSYAIAIICCACISPQGEVGWVNDE